MSFGAKMRDDLKLLILKNSQWKDDRRQFKIKTDRMERKKYLLDFRAKILKYKEGQEVKVPFENAHKVIERMKARGDLPQNYNYQLVQRQPLI